MICFGYITFWENGYICYVTYKHLNGKFHSWRVLPLLGITDPVPADLQLCFDNLDKSIYKF